MWSGNVKAAKPEKAECPRTRFLLPVFELIRENREIAQQVLGNWLRPLRRRHSGPGHHFHFPSERARIIDHGVACARNWSDKSFRYEERRGQASESVQCRRIASADR
jgi:hypothetical protein